MTCHLRKNSINATFREFSGAERGSLVTYRLLSGVQRSAHYRGYRASLLREEMRKVTNNFEVLVVDDGSKDQTGAILDRLATELPFLRVIHHERNLGYGAALITGFKNARKDLIFYTDGDGQYDVRELHNLLAQLKPNIDLVNGYKVKRADAWYRIWIGAMYRRRCAGRFVFRFATSIAISASSAAIFSKRFL